MAEFKLPDLGENIESGDVVSLLVGEGDVIKPQQEVIELETEKAVIAVPSDVGGKVSKIHVSRGQTVKPGQVILTVESTVGATATKPAGAAAKSAAKPQPPARAAPSKPAVKTEPAKAAPTAPVPTAQRAAPQTAPPRREPSRDADGRSSPAGPAVRRLARELGVDLARVGGTGPAGRITRDDVVGAVRQSQAAMPGAAPDPHGEKDQRDSYGVVRREAMTKIRKTIAANMIRSASTIPHLTNFDDADITELDSLRRENAASESESGVKLTSLAFVLKAIALALKQHPMLNASVDMEAGEIIYKQYVNLGVAVDTERGLIVPVLRDVERLSIPQIAQGIQALAEKVRTAQQTLEDLRGGTFTVSNLGAVGGKYSTPIINYPEVAILLIGRARKMPVVTKDDRIEPRLMMPLSLSYDHRLVDGAAASRFLNEVIGYLELPGRLLLAP